MCRYHHKWVTSRQWGSNILTWFVRCLLSPDYIYLIIPRSLKCSFVNKMFSQLSRLVIWTCAYPLLLWGCPRTASLDFQAQSNTCVSLRISWCLSLSLGLCSPFGLQVLPTPSTSGTLQLPSCPLLCEQLMQHFLQIFPSRICLNRNPEVSWERFFPSSSFSFHLLIFASLIAFYLSHAP